MKVKLTAVRKQCSTVKSNKQFFRNFSLLVVYFSFLGKIYSQNVGINTTGNNPSSKALLDINADNVTGQKGGVLFPRLTTVERNALSATGSTTESLLIYNTTTQCFEAWNQTTPGWVALGCINCLNPPVVTLNAANYITCTSFNVSWSASTCATGYFLDVSTSSTFASFVAGYNNLSVGNKLNCIVSGLTFNVSYYVRIRAVNQCGTSFNSNTINVLTGSNSSYLGCSPCQIESDYNTITTDIFGVPKKFITRNLGAAIDAVSANSSIVGTKGCYFQFNRSQAYGANAISVSPAWTITSINEGSDWLLENDPCYLQLGLGWRIPTDFEWVGNNIMLMGTEGHPEGLAAYFGGSLVGMNYSGYTNGSIIYKVAGNNGPNALPASWIGLNWNDAFSSIFKFNSDNGDYISASGVPQWLSKALFWSYAQTGAGLGVPSNAAYYVMFGSPSIGATDFVGSDKAIGLHVRCIKDL